jgi:hypothetical protein
MNAVMAAIASFPLNLGMLNDLEAVSSGSRFRPQRSHISLSVRRDEEDKIVGDWVALAFQAMFDSYQTDQTIRRGARPP